MNRILTALFLSGCVTFSSFGGEGDSAVLLTPEVARYDFDAIPKDPLASAFFSATIPGSGQIYNKEFLRGIVTAVGFYAGLFTAQYMVDRWEQQNTDTVYFQETNDAGEYNGVVRQVYVARPDDKLEGLPTEEKIVLGTAAAMTVGFWVWGVFDSYKGAKRYNTRLFGSQQGSIKLGLNIDPRTLGTQLTARVGF